MSPLPAAQKGHTAPPLGDGEVHVWYCWTDACLDAGHGAAYRALLAPDELARMERFHFDYLKREYLVTRALCRLTLSRYAPVHPKLWRFRANAYGRPEIAAPMLERPLHFNLSNARSLVACAVSRAPDVGVDVEEIDRHGETIGIADRYFSSDELRALHAAPAERRQQRFFEFWTLKESYIKARGMGLSIPLEQFSFEVADSIRIGFDPSLSDDADDWHFELHRPSARHQLAVGTRRGGSPACRVTLHEVVPDPSPAAPARAPA